MTAPGPERRCSCSQRHDLGDTELWGLVRIGFWQTGETKITQYFSGTNRLFLSVAPSSNAPFLETLGSLIFSELVCS
jgi:hypothetical protein